MDTTRALVRETRVAAVLEKILTGEASTTAEACELAGVPRSTFYRLCGNSEIASALAELKQAIALEVFGQSVVRIPKIVKGILDDAEEAETSRDRQDARRTLLMYIGKLGLGAEKPEEAGEPAKDWLSRRNFSPVQVNIYTTGKEEPPTVEVEGSEVEK